MGDYSETLMEHFSNPRNNSPMPDADLVGRAGAPGRGPFFILYLRLWNGAIASARYQCHGCGSTIAAGSMLTEMIAGRSIPNCLGLTVEDLVQALDGVPAHKRHSPHMAIAALRDALGRHQAG